MGDEAVEYVERAAKGCCGDVPFRGRLCTYHAGMLDGIRNATEPRKCETCGGNGYMYQCDDSADHSIPCPTCDGSGVLPSFAVLRDDLERVGFVSDAGGGVVRVLADRDLAEYPIFQVPVYIERIVSTEDQA